MVINLKSFFAVIFIFFTGLFLFQQNSLNAQTEKEDDPRTWKYFKIFARAQDDSVFIKLQNELNIDPKLESYVFIANIMDPSLINQYVVIGDETSPDASRFLWSDLSADVQKALLNWVGSNKENLNKKKLNFTSVFFDVFKKIKVKEVIAPPARERDILSTTAYISPYFQIFGGDPLGIPIKKSVGFDFQLGTPYSGPMETDIIGTSFHILGFKVGVTSRIQELVFGSLPDTDVTTSPDNLAYYNNLFAPDLGLAFSYVLPFGNFFEIGFFTTLDTGNFYPKPVKVKNEATGQFMPNNIIRGNYTNFEFRYPFRAFGSTRSKIYFAQSFGEKHIGFAGRELRFAGSQFDFRVDATLSGKRNFQILVEPLISSIGEGFALSSFAIGPSFRFGRKPDNNFGLMTVLVNMRLKIGDFFEERGDR
ncbi:MAG: hypothetical protein IPJ45_04150 [Ignavibacteria bacterium]|nr:hypothetical protein [Ignavibacteria bacterium]